MKQHRPFNGTYKYLKQIEGQPIWQLMIFDGKSGTKSNAIWKPSKNCINCPNGHWMIGEMEDRKNPKIRGDKCKASPDDCKEWNYVKKKKDKWQPDEWVGWNTSTVSGIKVKCMKGKKFLREAIVHHFKIIFLQKPYISS